MIALSIAAAAAAHQVRNGDYSPPWPSRTAFEVALRRCGGKRSDAEYHVKHGSMTVTVADNRQRVGECIAAWAQDHGVVPLPQVRMPY